MVIFQIRCKFSQFIVLLHLATVNIRQCDAIKGIELQVESEMLKERWWNGKKLAFSAEEFFYHVFVEVHIKQSGVDGSFIG